ncbi:hypothetical protein MAHJHV59_48010 [Mycobacterium avium subsp. hominissuis]
MRRTPVADLDNLCGATTFGGTGQDFAADRREILAGATESGCAAEVIEIGDRRAAIRHAGRRSR